MTNENFLKKIKDLTIERTLRSRRELSPESLQEKILLSPRRPLDFIERLKALQGPRIIAEIKRSSPSRGPIAPDLKPTDVAMAYNKAGAAAISVLTEPHYFGGSKLDLQAVRAQLPEMPLLMKDFVLDSYQLLEAKYFGADAVLLIHTLLGQDQLHELYNEAIYLGLTPLVEVHSELELEDALQMGARLIGVNNRNLNNLKIDLSTTQRLASRASNPELTLIAESGIESADQIVHLNKLGYAGFLIGTKLMSTQTPEASLRSLIKETR
jgi:indole-3-glycerol phosphate synthase